MAVRSRYEPALYRVKAIFLLQLQAHLESLPDKACSEGTACGLACFAGFKYLLKLAFLIRRAHTQRTFLSTFNLENLCQRLSSLPRSPVSLGVILAVPGVARVGQSPCLVRVVRNSQEIAVPLTVRLELAPQFNCIRHIDT